MATNTEVIEQTVSAALDGERVDVDTLRGALATQEGRDALAAFVLLRAASAADEEAAVTDIPTAAVARIADAKGRRPRVLLGYRVPAALAASLAALAVAGSFWLGTAWQPSPVAVHLAPPPPTASRTNATAQVTPVATPIVSPVAPCGSGAVAPPTPTRMLRYVRGVDWRDGN